MKETETKWLKALHHFCIGCILILGIMTAVGTGGGGGGDTGSVSIGDDDNNSTNDDHGNSISSASIISVDQDIGGNLETSGDVDYFGFRAYDTTTYEIETTLETLPDSVIYLYDENDFEIANDDDGGDGRASRILWNCDLPEHILSNVFYVKVAGYSASHTGTYSLRVQEGGTAGGPQVTTLYAVADAYVNTGQPSSNFGDVLGLYTGQVNFGGAGTSEYRAFVKFDTSGIPATAQITNATLYLTAGLNSVPCDIQTAEASVTVSEVLNSSWTEYGLTYINMPSSFKYISTVTVSDFNDCVSHQHTWDVTEAVRDWVLGVVPNNGLSIKSNNIIDSFGTDYDYCTIYAREVAPSAGPYLVVHYTS